MDGRRDPWMDAWMRRSTRRPSRWRRFLARFGLVRQAPIGGPLEAFPPGAVSRATVELSQETIDEYARLDRELEERRRARRNGSS